MSLHRVYDLTGKPRYNAWVLVCDLCGTKTGIAHARAWWIPAKAFCRLNPEPVYCPPCAAGCIPTPPHPVKGERHESPQDLPCRWHTRSGVLDR